MNMITATLALLFFLVGALLLFIYWPIEIVISMATIVALILIVFLIGAGWMIGILLVHGT